jgi:hypothetical protein
LNAQKLITMVFCMGCGQRLPDAARFCASCGTPVAALPSAAVATVATVSPSIPGGPAPSAPVNYQYAATTTTTTAATSLVRPASIMTPVAPVLQHQLSSSSVMSFASLLDAPAAVRLPSGAGSLPPNAERRIEGKSLAGGAATAGGQAAAGAMDASLAAARAVRRTDVPKAREVSAVIEGIKAIYK